MAKRKQRILPGMEPPSIKAIDKAAEAYVDVRDRRMELTKEEVVAQLNLVAVMRENKLDTYEFDGQTVALVSKVKAKVKTKDGEEEGDVDGEKEE